MTPRKTIARYSAAKAAERELRDRVRMLSQQRKALRRILIELVDEAQPLGIDRPAYRAALAVIRETETLS